MVCLNEVISFKKLKFKKNLTNEINDEIHYNFHLNDLPQLKLESEIKSELTMIIINNMKSLITKKINNLFSSDHFIYLNMDDNICTYKHKRGKNDGKFCCKKITKKGNKDKYVCRIHNKEHKPEKRLVSRKDNVQKVHNDLNHISIHNMKINKNRKYNNTNKIKKRKKIIVNGIINFKEIINMLLV